MVHHQDTVTPAYALLTVSFLFPLSPTNISLRFASTALLLQYANNISPPRNTQKERNLNKIKADERPLFICCRFFQDTYRGVKVYPRLPVPTWFHFCHSYSMDLWKFRRGAEIYPILRYMRDPSNQ